MRKLAFVFPGQGAQTVGMGRAMAEQDAEARETFAEADDALGFSLSDIIFSGPEEKLRLTYYTQPALLTTSIALYRVFARAGYAPAFVAGHSLGEYSALVAAGSLSFADAVRVVHLRGRWMDEAVPAGTGAMAAVLGAERERLAEICRQVSREMAPVELANINCPGQIVISGKAEAVNEAGKILKEQGVRVIPLNVSGPFHSSLMQPAAEKLQQLLQEVEIRDAAVPVVANVSAQPVSRAAEIREALCRQVSSSVLWEDSVRFMLSQGVETFIEIGAGTVLSGLIKKVQRRITTCSIQDPDSLEKTLTRLKEEG